MAGEPAELADRVPVLLTPGRSAHPPSVASRAPLAPDFRPLVLMGQGAGAAARG
jgi:hypothetical protein